MNLYENKEGVRVVKVVGSALFHNGLDDAHVVVYRGVDIFRGPVGTRVTTHEVFAATFKPVEWTCGVDLYAILHEHVSKDMAAKIASEIEADLFQAEEARLRAKG